MFIERDKSIFVNICKKVLIILAILFVNIYMLFFMKQWNGLDGDFNGYVWGAKLAGIAEALKYKELRLWNPNIACGISGIHNFTDPFYPIALIICKLFWNDTSQMLSLTAYPVFVLFHSVIACIGTYYLLKDLKIGGGVY